ncbi:MAG: type II secretion system F family protein [Pirellulaceae bacterium]|nr:type II secretion system F family protein [Pirellulaceae bacterium]
MPEFSYVARDASGQRVTGSIEAVTKQEVLAALAGRSLFPVEIDARKRAEPLFSRRRVPKQLLAVTLSQLADLLQSGVPLLKSLEILKRQASHAGLREVFADLHRQVEGGATLSEAMRRHQRTFGQMTVSIVHAGSEGGFLEDSLSRVSSFIELQEDLKGRTIGGMAYPVLLAIFGSMVLVGLLVFVVPKFESIFDAMRQRGELPMLTEWLLGASRLAWRWSLWIVILGTMAVVAAWRWLGTEAGRRWRDLAKLRLPVAGPILRNLALARFCRTLGTMLRHGVPILQALKISSESANNVVLAEAIISATENISAGETLAQPLSHCKHFPETIVEMIAVAEESNRLNDVLIDIAESLERRTFRRLDLAVRLLEPVMLIFMAGIVLVVVVALMLPMFKMSTTLQ